MWCHVVVIAIIHIVGTHGVVPGCSINVSLQPVHTLADIQRLLTTLCDGGGVLLEPGIYTEFCQLSKPANVVALGRASIQCLFSVNSTDARMENIDFGEVTVQVPGSAPSKFSLVGCSGKRITVAAKQSAYLTVTNASTLNIDFSIQYCLPPCSKLAITMVSSNVEYISCSSSFGSFNWLFSDSTSASQVFFQSSSAVLSNYTWLNSNLINGDVSVEQKDGAETNFTFVSMNFDNSTFYASSAANSFSLHVRDSVFSRLRWSRIARAAPLSFIKVDYPLLAIPALHVNSIRVVRCSFTDSGNVSLGKTFSGGVALLIRHAALAPLAPQGSVQESVVVSNCNFTNLETASDGGAMLFYFHSGNRSVHTLTVQKCRFSSTSALGRGGAVAIWVQLSNISQSFVELSECEFSGCRGVHGGAVYIELNRENYTPVIGNSYGIRIEDCGFTDIESTGVLAGAIFLVIGGSDFGLEFPHVGFQAIASANVSISVLRVALRGCSGGYGAALAVAGSRLAGGAYAAEYRDVIVEDANGDGAGAAFWAILQQNSLVDVSIIFEGCYFARCNLVNTSEFAGGILRLESNCPTGDCSFRFEVVGCTFVNNSSPSSIGGALQLALRNSSVEVIWSKNQVAGMDCQRGSLIGVVATGAAFSRARVVAASLVEDGGTTSLLAASFHAEGTSTLAMELDNCTVVNQFVVGDGAAIDVSGTHVYLNIRVTNSLFVNNTVKKDTSSLHGSGGVASLAMLKVTGIVLYENCTFESNHAESYGGVHYQDSTVDSPSLTFTNCVLTGNSASTGGAVAVVGLNIAGQSTTFDHCSLRRNSADVTGGAAYSMSQFFVNGTLLEANTAKDGGALAGGYCDAESSIFVANGASVNGGAILATVEISIHQNVIFLDNHANGTGGAVWTPRASILGQPSQVVSFRDNTASSSGAVYLNEGDISFAEFTGNGAGVGGAVMGNTLTISNTYFIKNEAVVSGGAISIQKKCSITNCMFFDNKASNGGAVSSVRTTITLSKFKGNVADDSGGAVHSAVVLDINSCWFAGNIAIVGGAARGLGDANVTNSSFEGNGQGSMGGALFVTKSLYVKSSSFSNNTALSGGAISSMGSIVLVAVNFTSNQASQDGGAVYAWDNTDVASATFSSNTANRGGSVFINGGSHHSYQQTDCVGGSASFGGCYFSSVDGDSTVILSGCICKDNTATWGSAVHFSSSLELNGGVFSNNSAKSGGTFVLHLIDGINARSAGWEIRGASFLYNRVEEGAGGAILQLGGFDNDRSVILVSRVVCNSSTAGEGAGCIAVENGRLTVEHSLFGGNSASAGGAIASGASITILRSNRYIGNTARSGGGAVLSTSETLSLLDEYCAGGLAASGGCLAYQGSGPGCSVSVTGLISINNTAEEGGSAIITCNDDCWVQIMYSIVNSNVGLQGGALLLRNTTTTIWNSSFEGNKAASSGCPAGLFERNANRELCGVGGAIYQIGGSMELSSAYLAFNTGVLGTVSLIGLKAINVQNSSVINNVVSLIGGGLCLVASQEPFPNISIDGMKIMNNTALHGGGIHLEYPTNVIERALSGAEVHGNTAEYGPDWSSQIDQTNITITYLLGEKSVPALQMIHGAINQTLTNNGSMGRVPSGIPFTLTLAFFDLFGVPMKFPVSQGVGPVVTMSNVNASSGIIHSIDVDEQDRFCYVSHLGTCAFRPMAISASVATVALLTLQSTSLEDAIDVTILMTSCPPGYGYFDLLGPKCRPCEGQKYSVGGNRSCFDCTEGILCDNGLASSQGGYWIGPPDEDGKLQAFKCPTSVCLSGNKCSKSHDPASLLCGACVPGTYIWGEGCEACKVSAMLSFLYPALFILFANIYSAFITRTARPSQSDALKIALSYSQVATLLLPDMLTNFGETFTQLLGIVSGSPTAIPFSTCFRPVGPELQFHIPALFNAAVLMALVLQRSVVHFLRRSGRMAKASSGSGWQTTKNTLISLLFMATFSTTDSMFRFITCSTAGVGRSVVQSQPAIECKTAGWRRTLMYLSVYTGTSWVLWGAMIAVVVRDYRGNGVAAVVNWPFMFHNFKADRFRRVLESEGTGPWKRRCAYLASWLAQWWQIVVLIRRVTVLFAFAISRWFQLSRAVLVGAFLLVSLVLQLIVNPYRNSLDALFDNAGVVLLILAINYNSVDIQLPAFVLLTSGWSLLALYTLFTWSQSMRELFVKRFRTRHEAHESEIGDLAFTESSNSSNSISEHLDRLESSDQYVSTGSFSESHTPGERMYPHGYSASRAISWGEYSELRYRLMGALLEVERLRREREPAALVYSR